MVTKYKLTPHGITSLEDLLEFLSLFNFEFKLDSSNVEQKKMYSKKIKELIKKGIICQLN